MKLRYQLRDDILSGYNVPQDTPRPLNQCHYIIPSPVKYMGQRIREKKTGVALSTITPNDSFGECMLPISAIIGPAMVWMFVSSSLSQFICSNPNAQCDSEVFWRWLSHERTLMNEITAFKKETPESFLACFLPHEDTRSLQPGMGSHPNMAPWSWTSSF